MEKLEFLKLWDIYGGSFSAGKREISDMYLIYDLTISEIAEEKGISRQGVSDCLKKCKEELIALESELKIAKRLDLISLGSSQKIAEIERWAKKFKEENPQADLSPLLEILSKDYTEEAEKIYRKNPTK